MIFQLLLNLMYFSEHMPIIWFIEMNARLQLVGRSSRQLVDFHFVVKYGRMVLRMAWSNFVLIVVLVNILRKLLFPFSKMSHCDGCKNLCDVTFDVIHHTWHRPVT